MIIGKNFSNDPFTILVFELPSGYNLKSMNIILILTFLFSLPGLKTDLRELKDPELAKRVILTGSIPFITAFALDKPVQTFIQDNLRYESYLNLTNELGGKMALAGLGLLFLATRSIGDQKFKDFSYTAFESAVLAGFTSVLFKITIGRARPSKSSSPYKFNPPGFDDEYQALPSGHTTIAFAWLTVLANYYGENKIIKYGSYALASSTAIARVYKNRHWLSDCVLGAMIGYYFGKRLSQLHLKGG